MRSLNQNLSFDAGIIRFDAIKGELFWRCQDADDIGSWIYHNLSGWSARGDSTSLRQNIMKILRRFRNGFMPSAWSCVTSERLLLAHVFLQPSEVKSSANGTTWTAACTWKPSACASMKTFNRLQERKTFVPFLYAQFTVEPAWKCRAQSHHANMLRQRRYHWMPCYKARSASISIRFHCRVSSRRASKTPSIKSQRRREAKREFAINLTFKFLNAIVHLRDTQKG